MTDTENKDALPQPATSQPAVTQPPGRLTMRHIILILGVLIIICAAIITIVFLLRDSGSDMPAEPVPGGNLVIDESNLDSIMREVEEKVAEGMFETHMNTTWRFPDGATASENAVMGNAASNRYPFWFTVALADTGDIVYTSSLLPVGSQIKEVKLSEDLDEGRYSAIMVIHMVNDDGEEVESNMGFSITLVVEN
jgi:hypothetical protein